MLTYRVKRSHLDLPEAAAPVHPDQYVRVIEHTEDIILENASIADVPIEKDPATGRNIRRTLILKDIRPDPGNKEYVICTVEEATLVVEIS